MRVLGGIGWGERVDTGTRWLVQRVKSRLGGDSLGRAKAVFLPNSLGWYIQAGRREVALVVVERLASRVEGMRLEELQPDGWGKRTHYRGRRHAG